MAVLAVDHLTVRLGSPSREVISDVSVACAEGTATLLLGSNGCGKSVLMRTMLGLITPSAGTVSIGGRPLGRHARSFHKRCGVSFQNPETQLFGDSVYDDVAISVGDGEDDPDSVITRALDRFGIADCRDRAPWELSGGQKRRLALAGAFAANPEFLFLDEPFLELDYPAIESLLSAIGRFLRAGGTAIIASHESRDLWDLMDHVVILNCGKAVYSGAPAEAEQYVSPRYGLRPRSAS
jgi:energy-coupling factor transporter ATP-binding protein EcfA2